MYDVCKEFFAVLGVIYAELRCVAYLLGLLLQNTRKNGMEGAHPHAACCLAHHLHDALLHFFRRLVGEGEHQDGERIYFFLPNEVSHPTDKGPRFAASRACHYHAGTLRARHAPSLRLVKGAQQAVAETLHGGFTSSRATTPASSSSGVPVATYVFLPMPTSIGRLLENHS